MSNSLAIWKDLIISPQKGFSRLDNKTAIILPIIILAVLLIGCGLLQIPLITSDGYARVMTRIGMAQAEKMGIDLTDEMIAAIEKQQTSPLQKTIQLVSTIAGPLFTIFTGILLGALFLLIACKIAKGEVTYKLLFKFLLFLYIFQAVNLLLNNIFVLLTDWEPALAQVTTAAEYQELLVMNFSLAALLSRDLVGNRLFTVINYATNIFSVLFYIYCAIGLKIVAKISLKKSVIITIIMAAGGILITLATTSLF